MRIACIAVVLVTATSTLVGCQGLERGVTSHSAADMYTSQVIETSGNMCARQVATARADCYTPRMSLLDRIRGHRSNFPTLGGCDCQTAVTNTIIDSPHTSVCSRGSQPEICGLQQIVKIAPQDTGDSTDAFKQVASDDEAMSAHAVVPPPPSLKQLPHNGKMMISSRVVEDADLSSVVEPGPPAMIPDPTFGIYEKTAAPEFVVLPQAVRQETKVQQSQTHENNISQKFEDLDNDREFRGNDDFTPASQPIFPDLPSQPGAFLNHWLLKTQPVSSPNSNSDSNYDSETPQTILPKLLRPLPAIPVPQTPIQDPINERLALVPDQVEEISNQISEISKRVAAISERVFENPQPAATTPLIVQSATLTPVAESAGSVVPVADEPVILKARPKEKFSLTDNRVAAKQVSSPRQKQQQVPIYNVSHHALNQMGAPYPNDAVRPISQAETPNFSSPAVAKRAQTLPNLRYESDARRAQEQLFDIEALIQREIDRRIREGQLVPVKQQPAIQPQSPIQTEAQQTADLNRVPVLQVSQPVINSQNPDVARSKSSAISLPVRRPGIPAEEFGFSDADDTPDDSVVETDEGCAEYQSPNLFVPVLEIDTLQPRLMEIDVNADPNDNTLFDRGVLMPSRIELHSVPNQSGANCETNPEQEFAPRAQQPGQIWIDSPSTPIQDESAGSGKDVMLRLRATANPTVPQSSSPIVKIRKVSTQFRYQQPQYRDDQVTPQPTENDQPPATGQEPGMMEIRTIRALPIQDNEALQQEIRGLTERPEQQGTSAARIIER